MDRMIKHILVISTISAAFVVLLAGCRKSLKEFSFSYSIESVDNYKTIVSFNSNKTYKIEIYNYYMDNHAGKREPVIKEGTLTEEEYKTVEMLLTKCNLFKMNDSYGFDQEADEYIGDVICQIHFQTPKKGKFISIRNIDNHTFPVSFVNLLGYTNTFLSKHK
ncbi:MAG: hypothetical protein LBL58_18985 [Tannerellaceae bacterium]|jgi:hypothetical protein|nr:hypothetical protein [Tannerellaceae bacterium]